MKSETLSLKIIKKQIGFSKENSYYSMYRLKRKDLLLLASKFREKKILDPRNAEEHQSFLRKKNRKSVKQSDRITYKPKTFENPSNVDIKSVITFKKFT